MQRIRVGICIGDQEYQKRFTSCLMNHYKTRFELHVFSGIDQIEAQENQLLDVLVLSDCEQAVELLQLFEGIPKIYLAEEEEIPVDEEGEMSILDKYENVNQIVDEILRRVGNEIKEVREKGYIRQKTKVVAVYSLSENEFQLPFVATMASIMGETQRVLILDLQENSGLSQLASQQDNAEGLEDLLVMAEHGKYSQNRVNACIGHMDKMDYVYPVSNAESLCEMEAATYLRLIQMLSQELEYETILLNLSVRFVGFFEVLNQCHEIFFLQKKGGLCQWRVRELENEMKKRGYKELWDRMIRMETPMIHTPVTSCERLIEQWKWNDFGDMIRKMNVGEQAVG